MEITRECGEDCFMSGGLEDQVSRRYQGCQGLDLVTVLEEEPKVTQHRYNIYLDLR